MSQRPFQVLSHLFCSADKLTFSRANGCCISHRNSGYRCVRQMRMRTARCSTAPNSAVVVLFVLLSDLDLPSITPRTAHVSSYRYFPPLTHPIGNTKVPEPQICFPDRLGAHGWMAGSSQRNVLLFIYRD